MDTANSQPTLNANVPANGAPLASPTPQEVKLPAEQYNALLDRLVELEGLATRVPSAPREPVTDLDRLAEEGRRRETPPARPAEQIDVDGLTNTQLADLIINEVNRQGGERVKQLEVAVESIRLMHEIDRCEKKYTDFSDYEPDIRKLAMANPSLSIEQAYKLAKIDKEESGKGKGTPANVVESTTAKLFKLPPRVIGGEKPGMPSSSTAENKGSTTTRSAAMRAWDEIVGKGKNDLT